MRGAGPPRSRKESLGILLGPRLQTTYLRGAGTPKAAGPQTIAPQSTSTHLLVHMELASRGALGRPKGARLQSTIVLYCDQMRCPQKPRPKGHTCETLERRAVARWAYGTFWTKDWGPRITNQAKRRTCEALERREVARWDEMHGCCKLPRVSTIGYAYDLKY